MKFKKLALVLVVVLMASTLAPVFAKSPFADVPADHWAYDSVVELAAAGLIEGYPDGTFGGSRMMTRYEAAMVFARALSRLETQIGNIDVLPELDKIKADLMDEIKAQLAELDKPVVETKVLEKVTVEKELDEDALARLRAAEIAAEALEGDIAYVEARVLGLIDGIRYDVNQVQEKLDASDVEVPSMEEIEALIAAKVEEGILEAALSAKEVVKETTIVEKAVSTVPEVTEEDVEAIAEALITQQLQKYDILVRENRDYIVGILDRLDDIEAEQTEMKTAIAELEKVKFSGKLVFDAKSDSGEDFEFTQTSDLNLHIKASDSVNVKLATEFEITPFDTELVAFDNYRLEVTSDSPIKKLTVGKLHSDAGFGIGNGYVLPNANYGFAGLADIDIIDDLKATVLLGQEKAGTAEPVVAGLALEYKLMPELGIKVAGAAEKVYTDLPVFNAAGAGLFGEIANIEYKGDFAMDLGKDEDNMLFRVALETKIADVELDGNFTFKQENYGIAKPFVDEGSKYAFELGAGIDFLGLDLSGRYYNEAKAETVGKDISAFRLDATKDFNLFVPVSATARFASNTTDGAAATNNIFAKLAIEKDEDYGLRYGASAAYEKNVLTKVTWKDYGKYTGNDEATFGANVGYGLDWRGAKLDLDYDAKFVLPIEPQNQDSKLTHSIDLGYGFTDNVKLTLGGKIKQTLSQPQEIGYDYNAGLSISF